MTPTDVFSKGTVTSKLANLFQVLTPKFIVSLVTRSSSVQKQGRNQKEKPPWPQGRAGLRRNAIPIILVPLTFLTRLALIFLVQFDPLLIFPYFYRSRNSSIPNMFKVDDDVLARAIVETWVIKAEKGDPDCCPKCDGKVFEAEKMVSASVSPCSKITTSKMVFFPNQSNRQIFLVKWQVSGGFFAFKRFDKFFSSKVK